ncbi:hypothetical protein Isop_1470 [Isosphaera pallida ATCC 43644]|uniref:Uncharacterized protein n=1 Tax=Isosphaera pallida (strain ATCC 43644 / DSM 9630 / IS1B) TaxID=575540 RepID=E8QY65_ISOPI|nr:hypothetical protein Isop_1470 [Isosphaera pallida ATCC 43644]
MVALTLSVTVGFHGLFSVPASVVWSSGQAIEVFFDLMTTSQIVSIVDRQLEKSNTLLIDPLVSTEPGRMADSIARGLDPRLEGLPGA